MRCEHIRRRSKECSLALQAMSDSTETNYRWNWNQVFSTSYMANNFTWANELPWDEGLSRFIRLVERFMQEDDTAAKKLRSIPKVIVGGSKAYKILQGKDRDQKE